MKKLIFAGTLLLSANILLGQNPEVYKLRLSYSLLDVPQNLNSAGRYPSMIQSAELSSGLYDLSFWGIDAAGNAIVKNRNNTFGGKFANTGLKYLLGFGFSYYGSELPIPLGVFTHEEFHRSVLGVNNISATATGLSIVGTEQCTDCPMRILAGSRLTALMTFCTHM